MVINTINRTIGIEIQSGRRSVEQLQAINHTIVELKCDGLEA